MKSNNELGYNDCLSAVYDGFEYVAVPLDRRNHRAEIALGRNDKGKYRACGSIEYFDHDASKECGLKSVMGLGDSPEEAIAAMLAKKMTGWDSPEQEGLTKAAEEALQLFEAPQAD